MVVMTVEPSDEDRNALIVACKAGAPTVLWPPPTLRFRVAGKWPLSGKSGTELQTIRSILPGAPQAESQDRSSCTVLPVIQCRTEHEFWDLAAIRPCGDLQSELESNDDLGTEATKNAAAQVSLSDPVFIGTKAEKDQDLDADQRAASDSASPERRQNQVATGSGDMSVTYIGPPTARPQ
jgi:hypothetical protein